MAAKGNWRRIGISELIPLRPFLLGRRIESLLKHFQYKFECALSPAARSPFAMVLGFSIVDSSQVERANAPAFSHSRSRGSAAHETTKACISGFDGSFCFPMAHLSQPRAERRRGREKRQSAPLPPGFAWPTGLQPHRPSRSDHHIAALSLRNGSTGEDSNLVIVSRTKLSNKLDFTHVSVSNCVEMAFRQTSIDSRFAMRIANSSEGQP